MSKTVHYTCQLEKDNTSLREEVIRLKAALDCLQLNEDALQKKEDKVLFYSGLPSFVVFKGLFTLVKDSHLYALQQTYKF